MSRLVARLLLSMLMLPAGVLVYAVALLVADALWDSAYYTSYPWRMRAQALTAAGAAWAFVVVYWCLLWRGGVRWTPARVRWTAIGTAASMAAGALVGSGIVLLPGYDEAGWFLGSVAVPIAWLIATVFAWRETAIERAERAGGGASMAVVCPRCGYNLTGLTTSRCPECGEAFTLDQLFKAQRGEGELEA